MKRLGVTVSALALCLGLAVGGTPATAAWETKTVAQLAAGDPIRKLAILHAQEVFLEEMVLNACLVSAGIEASTSRNAAYAARDTFEATIGDIEKEVLALDDSVPAVRRLKREIGSKKDLWYRFRVVLERELKAETPSPEALSQIALVEENLVGSIDRVYKVVKRKAMKSGQVDLGAAINENQSFQRRYLATKLVKSTCLVSAGIGDALARAKLGEAIEHFDAQLASDAGSILASEEIKAQIAGWQAILPALRDVAAGKPLDAGVIEEMQRLRSDWQQVVKNPAEGVVLRG